MCIYYLYCVNLKISDLNWACFLFSLLDLLLAFLGKIFQVKMLVLNNTDNGLLVTYTGENTGCARIILQHPGHFLDLSMLDRHYKQEHVFISVRQQF